MRSSPIQSISKPPTLRFIGLAFASPGIPGTRLGWMPFVLSVYCQSGNARVGNPASVRGEPVGTSGSIHGLGYLFSALRREGLMADDLGLQLATFLRARAPFLELTSRTLALQLTDTHVPRA